MSVVVVVVDAVVVIVVVVVVCWCGGSGWSPISGGDPWSPWPTDCVTLRSKGVEELADALTNSFVPLLLEDEGVGAEDAPQGDEQLLAGKGVNDALLLENNRTRIRAALLNWYKKVPVFSLITCWIKRSQGSSSRLPGSRQKSTRGEAGPAIILQEESKSLLQFKAKC